MPYTNQSIYFSIAFGCFYILTALMGSNTFVVVFLFLPGITFPFTTSYYNLSKLDHYVVRGFVHFLLANGIYQWNVWLFSLENQVAYIHSLNGMLGSFLYLGITVLLLNKDIRLKEFVVSVLLSGASFLLIDVVHEPFFLAGVSVCFWTVVNGVTMHRANLRELKRVF